LAKVEAGFETVGALPQGTPASSGRPPGFPRASLGEAMGLAREANGYTFASLSAGLDRKAPWFQIKEDPRAAATSVYVTRSVRVVDNLKTILAPALCVPHTAQRLACGASTWGTRGSCGGLAPGTQQVVEYQEETRSHEALTYDHTGAVGTWSKSELPPGQALREPAPLFKKLDESVIEEEYARLAG
jgi:methionyl-tRNA synthetase